MGYGADVAEFAADHGITDLDEACELYNDPGIDFDDFRDDYDDDDGPNHSPSAPPRRPRSRSRNGDRVCRYWLRGRCRHGTACRFLHRRVGHATGSSSSALEREQLDPDMSRRIEKTHAVMRYCSLRGKDMIYFHLACVIVGITDDPLAVAESGEEVAQTVFQRLDAVAREQNTSSDALIQRKKAECIIQ